MCGIVGVVRRRSHRAVPDVAELDRALEDAIHGFDSEGPLTARLERLADPLEAIDTALRGVPGVQAILANPDFAAGLETRVSALEVQLDAIEHELDSQTQPLFAPAELEAVNAALVRARDAAWAVRRDRLRTARAVEDLAGPQPSTVVLEAFLSIQMALAAIDRLEVRGRDSAGLHLLVRGHGLDLDNPEVRAAFDARAANRLFGSGSVREADGCLSFVYKAAAEIGELGDNTSVLRAAIRSDNLLARALECDSAEVVVLGHTRWASVGIISEANAHPLNQEEIDRVGAAYVVGTLNGDVDNYADLTVLEHLHVPAEITTDAKVIPTLIARRLEAGKSLTDAFRSTVSELEGSLAIGAQSAADPEKLLLSLRGSGQALYVGLAEDAFIVASEPYGLVEETSEYVRMDGETPADPDRPSATRGQVVVLDTEHAGAIAGITRAGFDGTLLPVKPEEIQHAEITTRDIDRGTYPHFLLKEISEAPASFRKTLRGKIVERDGRLEVALGEDTLPAELRTRLRSGAIRRVVAIGQGTAAIAGQSLAAVLDALAGSHVRADAQAATELSGFDLSEDMSDTIVVAISQSGTTTDTNRTVDLVRGRGAHVIAVVNRRNSDLVDKADGVLFTSDGRDLEMAVPSTKAFYAQVAAGYLIALAIATEFDALSRDRAHEILTGLRELPDAMQGVLAQRDAISVIAQRHAPSHRYWTIVGNGLNRIAANEVRIKLSELCYKSVSSDIAEDKKHIDLCTEPLILVCAVGLQGSNADDTAKEVAYHRAHRATPIVITTTGEDRFTSALETITVPPVDPALGFVLSTMAGHLFGYEAALAIDASARPMREARAAIQLVVTSGDAAVLDDDVLGRLSPTLTEVARVFFDGLRAGRYDGDLEAGTAVQLASLLRYAIGSGSLDLYEVDFGKVGTPSIVVEDLTAALTQAINELTRTVDTIKHQAKTVTVGISRSDDELLRVELVKQVLAAGAARDALTYRSLRTLVALDQAVNTITGYTRYRLEGDLASDTATLHVIDTTVDFASRTLVDPTLRGTKHRVATLREVTVARGRNDGRTVLFVPEVKGNEVVGLTLLHVDLPDRLPAEIARAVLQGYQGRYGALKDAVTETVPDFDDARLASFDLVELLTEPVYVLADRWLPE